jgi:vanillate O-demethylase monooxygenase subunit
MTRFLRHQWYAAAWADEVRSGAPLARTILNEPVLIWRSTDGTVNALADICPHRWAPLSRGKVDDEGVRCGYHGLRFAPDGQCLENPHGPVTGGLCVRSYPLRECHAMLWIWMGERPDGDPATIPDLGFVDTARPTALSKGYMHTRADHKLLEDNILDLSHADYLHPDTLGGGSITRSKPRVEERGDTVFVQWLSTGEPPIPIFRPLMRAPDAPADMWTEVLWHPCGVMLLHTGATEAGTPPDEGIDTWNAHIMTPETERTTHYFYVNTRNYRVDDAEFNAGMAAGLQQAFEIEDKPMIEAQQQRLGDRDLFDLAPRLLPIDNGSTRARRIYARLLAAEQARPAPPPA